MISGTVISKAADISSCFLIPDNKKMADCVLKAPLKQKFSQEKYDADPYYCFGAARYDAMSRGWNCKDNFKESLNYK